MLLYNTGKVEYNNSNYFLTHTYMTKFDRTVLWFFPIVVFLIGWICGIAGIYFTALTH
jgi:hypothetical protein